MCSLTAGIYSLIISENVKQILHFLSKYSSVRVHASSELLLGHDLTLFDLTLFDLTLFDLTLFDLTLFDLSLFDLTLFDLTLFDLSLLKSVSVYDDTVVISGIHGRQRGILVIL